MPKADGTPTDEELNQQIIASQDVSQHPRMLAMSAIADAHEADIQREHEAEGLQVDGLANPPAPSPAPSPAPAPAPTPAPTPAPKKEAATPSPAPAPAADHGKAGELVEQLLAQFGDEPIPLEILDPLKVRVKIAGEDRVGAFHEVRRGVQIDGGALARLEEANRILREAQAAAEAHHAAGTRPPLEVAPAPAPGQSSPASKDATEEAKQLVSAIFEGDEEKAANLVVNILARRQTPATNVNPDEIAARAASEVRQQLSVEEANAQFRSDFKDIATDPMLAGVADQFFAQAQAADPQKSYAQLLAEAGNATRSWMETKGLKPATEPARGSTRQEKLERKQRIDGQETRSLSRTEVPAEPQVETASQVIAEMRKQRGLV